MSALRRTAPRRIAEALGFSVVSTELDGEWMDVCFCDSKAGS